MDLAIWRLEALETPAWSQLCGPCGRQRDHRSTQLFRVNANGALHDIWLLYRCTKCDTTLKRRLFRRARIAKLGERLHAYFTNQARLAWEHAFEIKPRSALSCRVERAPISANQELEVVIQQPYFCALRWDRFLASELGWSRSAVTRAWGSGRLLPEASFTARSPVRDGQRVRIRMASCESSHV